VVKSIFIIIGLQTILYYVIIHLNNYNIQVYHFIICIRSILKKYPIRIRIRMTSALHSYSTLSVRIRICFKNMKTDLGRALSDPH
jgi:hypothetical protein